MGVGGKRWDGSNGRDGMVVGGEVGGGRDGMGVMEG
jgi:hypothetical protein